MTGKEPNYRDKSDEAGCYVVVFKNNYNKNTPPIESGRDCEIIPANVDHPDAGGGDRGDQPLHPPAVPDQLEVEGEPSDLSEP